jgi:hypothetical protein
MISQVEIKLEVPEFLVGTADIDKNELGEYIRQFGSGLSGLWSGNLSDNKIPHAVY